MIDSRCAARRLPHRAGSRRKSGPSQSASSAPAARARRRATTGRMGGLVGAPSRGRTRRERDERGPVLQQRPEFDTSVASATLPENSAPYARVAPDADPTPMTASDPDGAPPPRTASTSAPTTAASRYRRATATPSASLGEALFQAEANVIRATDSETDGASATRTVNLTGRAARADLAERGRDAADGGARRRGRPRHVPVRPSPSRRPHPHPARSRRAERRRRHARAHARKAAGLHVMYLEALAGAGALVVRDESMVLVPRRVRGPAVLLP